MKHHTASVQLTVDILCRTLWQRRRETTGIRTLLLYLLRPLRLVREYGIRPFRSFFRGLLESWRE